MLLLDHIDTNDLLKGEVINDALYARMVDGRTIHQYFQFIEPILKELYPCQAVDVSSTPLGYSLDGAISPRKLAQHYSTRLQPALSYSDHTALRGSSLQRAPGVIIDVTVEPSSSNKNEEFNHFISSRQVTDTFTMLDVTGLSFFVDLSTGKIRYSHDSEGFVRHSASLRPELSAQDNSFLLLSSAARSFLTLWIEAESFLQIEIGYESKVTRTFSEDILELFSCSVVLEFARRFNFGASDSQIIHLFRERLLNFPPDVVFNLLSSTQGLFLCCELIACWYPSWQRSLFIFDSPFDTLSNLDEIYTRRASWIRLSKHRSKPASK